ncbi:MAG: hypothetical protein M1820_009139 [Bogoriella megaspora]|nr:MAG: hypothetical protein M1820_009139 [Bogoriella megaspora]
MPRAKRALNDSEPNTLAPAAKAARKGNKSTAKGKENDVEPTVAGVKTRSKTSTETKGNLAARKQREIVNSGEIKNSAEAAENPVKKGNKGATKSGAKPIHRSTNDARQTKRKLDSTTNSAPRKRKDTSKSKAKTADGIVEEADEDNGAGESVAASTEQNPFEYITVNRPFYDYELENDLNKGDDQLDEDELREHYRKETNECKEKDIYLKPVAEHPGWRFFTMRKAWKMQLDLEIGAEYRDPDAFDMYTYNDFYGYGLQELFENMFVAFNTEFTKKTPSLEELWAVVAALGHWVNTQQLAPWTMIGDCHRYRDTIQLAGCAFLSALNRLDLAKKLTADSDFKDIPLVMSLYVRFEDQFGEGFAKYDREWSEDVVAYAARNGINITGISGIEKVVKKKLETINMDHFIIDKPKKDEWQWKKAFKDFKDDYVGALPFHRCHSGKPQLGGEEFNIIKWTSKKRAEFNFEHKDPVPEEFLTAIARGEDVVLSRG